MFIGLGTNTLRDLKLLIETIDIKWGSVVFRVCPKTTNGRNASDSIRMYFMKSYLETIMNNALCLVLGN